MKRATAKPLKNTSNQTLWTDLGENASAQISGGRISIGETSPVDGLGRPIRRSVL
ncbi:hypothetical protein H6F98_13695 [Microcoleus sp. FACHB-SPT15]|jgi:hypothetical protein|uniref:hypothetical protein n=1 Tax=Microcoleus sp. FACHB-SPT15 TaxID=2692830 RepID=UPI0017857195|nr:hypothetical protein [Microcoleus sp. FACHB-SPT15]MBD1806499.1 hypothetical protein [Microcoleus sp. FACHB-SPT15]